jgi:predicted CxxxxCH...CXXCH cytochrome family protein
MLRSPAALAALVASLALTACDAARPSLGKGAPDAGQPLDPTAATAIDLPTCTRCHGDAVNGNAAPPFSVKGETAASAVEVGAHQRHLQGTSLRAPLRCDDCHLVPTKATDPGHMEGTPARVVFDAPRSDGLARKGGVTPSWDRATQRCSNVYCHGGSLDAGGTQHAPVWTGGGAEAACGTCHDVPPANGRHPAVATDRTGCSACHPGTMSPAGLLLTGGQHLDGQVQAAGGHPAGWRDPAQHGVAANAGVSRCTTCHGDLAGAGGTGAPACTTCHKAGGAAASFGTAAAPACTGCHGTAGGVASPASPLAAAPPRVTRASARAAGAHAAHLTGTRWRAAPLACAECHAVPAGPLHASGNVDVAFGALATTGGAPAAYDAATLGCASTYCHGNFRNGAAANRPLWTGAASAAACGSCHGLPPAGTHPTIAATQNCSGCHPGYDGVPGGTVTITDKARHLDGVVDSSSAHAVSAAWALPEQHGLQALDAAATGGRGPQACVGCHVAYGSAGVPTAAGVTTSDCNACHAAAGKASWTRDCTFCHGGNDNQTGAPPRDATVVRGTVQPTTKLEVGAHTSHVAATHAVDAPYACAECHVTPSGAVDATVEPGHIDAANATVTFGALGGATSTWTRANATCATYCHGGATTPLRGGARTTPVWTTVNGSFATCDACHGDPPPAPHVQRADCSACHTGYGNRPATGPLDGTTQPVNVAAHLNRVVDAVGLTCTTCHGAPGRTGAAGADAQLAAAPPADTTGSTAVASRGVGVHQAHVAGTRSKPVACSECHGNVAAYTTSHSDGTRQVAFGTLAKSGNGAAAAFSTTALTCASTYCHGAFTGGNGTAATPAWTTAGTLACTSCHGAPPALPHPQNPNCATCHAGYTATTVNAALHVNGVVDQIGTGCTQCHGTAGRTAFAAEAPPVDAKGNTATSARGVGAHQAHLQAGGLSTAIACTECHVVPPAGDKAHANGTAAVAFGTLARTGAVAPAYNSTAASCASTYCHGNFKNGATANAPVWTGTAQAACGTCHGMPPAGTHPALATGRACGDCHAGYNATAGTNGGTVNVATHVNGVIDVTGMTCTTCHGTPGRTGAAGADAQLAAAPPADAGGNTGTTFRGVGVHQAHVAGTRSKPVACSECHGNISGYTTSHSDGVRQVAFGTLAKSGNGAAAAFNTTALTCASTYCHGAFTGGNGTAATPAWTAAATLACTACHGNPPAASTGHVQRTDCGACHTGYTNASVALATHVNGVVDVVALTCTSCHGTPGRTGAAGADAQLAAAPPADSAGNAATTARGVGVHLSHVAGTRSKPVACAECHTGAVPTATSHANGTVTVAFGTLAKTGNGAAAAYSTTALTCASTYCHGAFTGGNGTAATPAWTAAGTLACTSCHGSPPALPHPQNPTCGTCHSGYTATTVNATNHVNGVVDQTGTGCTQCHGTPGRTTYAAEAPPIDAKGNTATTFRGVGAHAAHLQAGGLSNPIACTECHVVPPAGDKAHANGTAAVSFGALAKTGAVTPAFNTTAVSCASVYCHGNFTNGTTANVPVWTGTGQAACGTCHGIPPAGSHPTLTAGTACSGCHTGYTATAGTNGGTVNLTNHVNGKVDVTGGGESAGGTNCGGCHGAIFNAMVATSTKVTKHTIQSDTPSIGSGVWTGSTLKGSTQYGTASCVTMCHGDHPHNVTTGGTHEYNVHADPNARSATASATTRSKTDFDATLTTGGLCTGCHQTAVDASHPAVSKATFQGKAHDFVSNTVGATTYAWEYKLHDNGVFQRNCTKCHASPAEGQTPSVSATGSGTVGPHSSDFGSLLAGSLTAAGNMCMNCHGTGTANRSGKDIATDAAKAQGHGGRLNASNTHDTVREDASTFASGAFNGANRHVTCADCHDPHSAGKVRAAAGPGGGTIAATSPLNGASGAKFSATLPANWTAPTATNMQFVNPATAEYQICFKCHSAWAFGATPPAATATPSGLAGTDVAMEFNPNNKAGHPVVASNAGAKALAAGQLIAPWNTGAGTQLMTCSDCHNTDAASTSAQGPHGSAVRFMLAGTNKAWPYTVAGATSGTLFKLSTSGTGAGTANGLFCLNCHPATNSTGSNSLHRNTNLNGGQHGGNANIPACTSCHIRIPHGGKVSRLLVTTNAPARYKVGTPNFASITKGATKDSYSTSAFPAGFARGGCSTHSSTAGAELW